MSTLIKIHIHCSILKFLLFHFCFYRGLDFRSDYRDCSKLREITNKSVLFLTATATTAIVVDITEQFNLQDQDVKTITLLPDR